MSEEARDSRPDRIRTLSGQVVVALTLYAAYAGILSVLLPSRVAVLDPHGKVGSLALVTSISFGVTALAQPFIGAVSDRTTTRFGRRLPLMAVGALVGGVSVGLLGSAPTVTALAVLWAIGQLFFNGVDVPASAYLVDRFPPARRGLAAGVVGVAVIVGGGLGTVLAGALVARPATVAWIFAAGVLAAVAIFALLVRDSIPGSRASGPLRVRVRAAVGTLRGRPDYFRVLTWRICFVLSYGAVYGYFLYVLTDRVGLAAHEAARMVGVTTAIGGVAVVVSVLLGGWWSDRVRRRKPFVLATGALAAAGDAVLLASPTIAAVLVAAGLLGMGFGLSIGCGRALAADVIPSPERNAAGGFGFLNLATNLGQALAPMAAAALFGLGGFPMIFIACGLVALVSIVPIGFLRSR